jgi:steroid 5-alpha reductase family enzyme
MDLKQTGWEGVVLINLTQQKEKWQAVEHMVMNFVLCKFRGIS